MNRSIDEFIHKSNRDSLREFSEHDKILQRCFSVFHLEFKNLHVEGSHGLTIIVRNDSLEKGNRSLNLLLRKESNDTNLRQSSIVQLLNKSLSLLGLALLGRESKRIKEIQRNRVGDELRVIREVGEGTGFSSTHVMCSGSLGEPLEESDEEENLPFGGVGHSIPLLWGGSSVGGEWGSVEAHWPREVDSVGLNDVSCAMNRDWDDVS